MVKDIQRILQQFPEFVPEWIEYSEDQRCTPAWYISKTGSSEWTVGFFDRDGTKKHLSLYTDRMPACAAFIKNFMEGIFSRLD